MKWMQEQSKYENIAYVALWGLLFAVPLLSFYVRSASNSELAFSWQEVWMVWRHFAVYLLLFLIHNFLLAPLLIYRNATPHFDHRSKNATPHFDHRSKNRRWLYALLTLCMIGLFKNDFM